MGKTNEAMNLKVISAIIIIFCAAPFFSVCCQAHPSCTDWEMDNEGFKKRAVIENGWQEIKLNIITFSIPSNFSRVEKKCIDSECAKFESEDSVISVDINIDAGFPTGEELKSESFCEKYIRTDDYWVWLWRYKEKGTFPYQVGALFTPNTEIKWRIGIYYFSKSGFGKEIPLNIFRSVSINKSILK